jgi:hypothetical protein
MLRDELRNQIALPLQVGAADEAPGDVLDLNLSVRYSVTP